MTDVPRDDDELEPGYVTRQRQRRRALATMLVVVLALFFAFWYAYSYYRHDSDRIRDTPQKVCSTLDVVRPENVSVSVYNASGRAGLAAKTAKTLKSRGFVIEEVGNAPTGAPAVTAAAEIGYDSATANEAKYLATQVPGARLVEAKGSSSGVVTLTLGAKYTQLAPVVAQPTVTCR